MCEGPLLETYKGNFAGIFDGIKPIIEDSDYTIANLETPLAGETLGYTVTKDMYSFNTPDSFVDELNKLGINLVLTANNHCCDRGIEGLIQTIRTLEEKGMAYTGTYSGEYNPYIVDLNSVKIGIISCTASTNSYCTRIVPTINNVNLLREEPIPRSGIKYFLKHYIIGEYNLMAIKKSLGKKPTHVYQDNYYIPELADKYIDRICRQIIDTKKSADIVIVCPHMGGQFNIEPGTFSRMVMKRFVVAGADAVIASHPHVIQKLEFINDIPCAFSLGNVSMSMNTMYVIPDGLPQFGMILHLYLDGKTISKISYSLIEIKTNETGNVTIVPLNDGNMLKKLSNRINGKEQSEIRTEYII